MIVLFLSPEQSCCTFAPRDCQDVMDSGTNESGIYTITLEGTGTSFDVYCDLAGDSAGWIVSLISFGIFTMIIKCYVIFIPWVVHLYVEIIHEL